MTKVFISWSGSLSKAVAEEMRNWIPLVLQGAKPYFTPDDIEKGTRWSNDIAKELEASTVGIICLTKENLEKPWIMFEAGALSKKLDSSFVCPILFGLSNSDIKGPLVQFQASEFSKKDIYKIVNLINDNLGDKKVEPAILDTIFERWWPDLEKKITELIEKSNSQNNGEKQNIRNDRELIEEILEITRVVASKQRSEKFDRSRRMHIPSALIDDLIGLKKLLEQQDFKKISKQCASSYRDLDMAISFLIDASRIFRSERPDPFDLDEVST